MAGKVQVQTQTRYWFRSLSKMSTRRSRIWQGAVLLLALSPLLGVAWSAEVRFDYSSKAAVEATQASARANLTTSDYEKFQNALITIYVRSYSDVQPFERAFFEVMQKGLPEDAARESLHKAVGGMTPEDIILLADRIR